MSVSIKNVILGEGGTKVCVPIIGKNEIDICKQAEEICNLEADIVEWRVDFYDDVLDVSKVLKLIVKLDEVVEDKPILFTFRTNAEGGEQEISNEDYEGLIKEVIKQNIVGAVDVELFKGENILEDVSTFAKNYDVKVIASNHDFNKTPDKEEIKNRLRMMKKKGAHVSKMAVMPNDASDVLTLLAATEELHREDEDMVIITMSMGSMGLISRLGGGAFGSTMTFGARNASGASAPGQIEVGKLKGILNIIEDK